VSQRESRRLVYMGMSVAQARQLQFYIDSTEDYYGNQREFRKREDELIHVLQIGIDRATSQRSGA
jgi:hypothetical protein